MMMPNPVDSNYRETFKAARAKNSEGVESCKPHEKYNPTLSRQKYRTEYSGEYVKQAIAKKKVFECLSPQELKNYVMTILND
jgi:hypothetical protein